MYTDSKRLETAKSLPFQVLLIDLYIREVLLHVKREHVRVTSDSGAQIRYTSRSRTLLGFASRRDVSADKQAHRYQQTTRQQPIRHIRKQEWTYTAKWHYVNLLATRENRDVWRVASREKCYSVHRFWWRHTR